MVLGIVEGGGGKSTEKFQKLHVKSARFAIWNSEYFKKFWH